MDPDIIFLLTLYTLFLGFIGFSLILLFWRALREEEKKKRLLFVSGLILCLGLFAFSLAHYVRTGEHAAAITSIHAGAFIIALHLGLILSTRLPSRLVSPGVGLVMISVSFTFLIPQALLLLTELLQRLNLLGSGG